MTNEKVQLDNASEEADANNDFKSMDELVVYALDTIQELADLENDIRGVPTGFSDLNRFTGGFDSGDLIVLASRPSMGKSTLALNIGSYVAVDQGLPVLIFSTEANCAKLTNNAISSYGKIDGGHLKTGKLTDEEWPRISDTIEKFSFAPLVIDDTPRQTIKNLKEKSLRRAKKSGQIGLIVVDCLQMMDGDPKEILLSLKSLAHELSCPVLLTCQVGDSVEFRSDKRPIMFDLRDIPSIEMFADKILFLYRDEFYTKQACREPGVAELIIAKQRTGPTGVVKLAYLSSVSKFENILHN